MKKNLVLILICLGVVDLLGAIDLTGLVVALPQMTKDLGVSVALSQWILNAYTLTLVASLILFGKLGDFFGAKKLFIIGITIFGLTSLVLGFSSALSSIIAIRAIQGLGTAILYTMSTTIVAHLWDQKEKAFAVTASFFSIGMLVGPVLGGVFANLDYGNFHGWHFFFLMNVPLAIISLVLAIKLIPTLPAFEHRKIDYFSSLLLFLSLGSLVIFLSTFNKIALLGIILFMLTFIIYEKKVKNPTFDFELFKERNFTFGNFFSFFAAISAIGLAFVLTFYLQDNLGWNSLQAGLAVLPIPLVTVIFSIIGGYIKNKKIGAILSATLIFLGLLILNLVDPTTSYFKGILVGLIFVGAGSGFLMTSVFAVILDSVEKEKYGAASGILNTVQEMGGLIGIALVSGIIVSYSLAVFVLMIIALLGFISAFFIKNSLRMNND